MRYFLFLIPRCNKKNSGSHLHLLLASALLLLFPLLQDSCHPFQLSSSAPQQPPLLLLLVRHSRSPSVPSACQILPHPCREPTGSPWPVLPVGIHHRHGCTHRPLGPTLSSHTAPQCTKPLNSFILYLDFSPYSDLETSVLTGPCVQLPSVHRENLPEFCVFGIVVLGPYGTRFMDQPWRS